MNSKWTKDQVLERADEFEDCVARDMLRAYAATITKPADAGVTDEDATIALSVFRNGGWDGCISDPVEAMRIALQDFAARHARQVATEVHVGTCLEKDPGDDVEITWVNGIHGLIPPGAWDGLKLYAARHARQGEVVAYIASGDLQFLRNVAGHNLGSRECRVSSSVYGNMNIGLYLAPPAQPEQAKAGDWDAVKLIADFIGTIGGDGYWHSEDDTNPLRMDMRKLSTQLTAALPTTKGDAPELFAGTSAALASMSISPKDAQS